VLVASDVVPLFVESLEQELGNVGQGAGLAAVHAAGGDVGEEFSEDEVEGDGVLEIPAEGQEFGADFLGGLELEEFAMVEEAELLARVAEHAAAAAVGELEIAAWLRLAVRGAGLFRGHESGCSFRWIFLPRACCVLWIFALLAVGEVMLAKSGLRGPACGARRQAGRRLVYGESVAWGLLTVNSTGVVIIRTAPAESEEVRVTQRAWRAQRL
jgi:hypothetical protein